MWENLVPIGVWIAVVLTGLALVAVVLFGIRSALNGKLRPVALVSMGIPALLFVILYFVFGGTDEPAATAAIWTTLIMVVLGIGAVLVSGIRGAIS